jgi:hypothetical protein
MFAFVRLDAITTSMEHNLAGATDWRVVFPCATSRMPSRMSGWLLLSKTAVSELGERLWDTKPSRGGIQASARSSIRLLTPRC